MATNLWYVMCQRCEGTGQKLNWYDPPKQLDVYGLDVYGIDKLIESNKRFSPNGREMFDEKCPICMGKGRLSKLYLYD